MAVSQNSLKNLNYAKKGEVRNPKGRPHKLPDLDKLMAEVLGNETNGVTAAQKILDALKRKAEKGDIKAAEVLFDRGYGKAKQAVELSGDVGITWNEIKTYNEGTNK